MITDISDEQFDLLHSYRSKWQQWAFSLDPLDRSLAIETLNAAYLLAGYTEPKLFFFNNPRQAIEHLGFPPTRTPLVLVNPIGPIIQQVRAQFLPILWTRFWRRSGLFYARSTAQLIAAPAKEMLQDRFDPTLCDPVLMAIETHGSAISDLAHLDFCITVLGCTHTEPERWQIMKGLIHDCFGHIAFEDICIVFDRPIQF